MVLLNSLFDSQYYINLYFSNLEFLYLFFHAAITIQKKWKTKQHLVI